MKLNLILLCGLFSAVGIARAADTKSTEDWLLISPIEGASVATQTEKQKDFLALPRETRLARFADANARIELARAGWQVPCSLRWQCGTAPYEVQCVVGPFHDMKRVDAAVRVRTVFLH